MGTTAKQQEFVQLLTNYMQPAGKDQPLREFIGKLKFDDARDCTGSFFELEPTYQQARKKYATVFPLLAVRCVEKGEPYFALRAEILINSTGTSWERFYREQPDASKRSISKAIKAKKRGLAYTVRTFIDHFDRYMKRKTTQQKVAAYVDENSNSAKTADMAHQCLLAYIEISQGYKDGNGEQSLLIFYEVSILAIHRSPVDFVFDYEQRIKQSGSVWKLRFDSLQEFEYLKDRAKEILSDINKRKTIRSDVTAGGKTHKDVPTGKHQIEPPPPEKVQPADSQKQPEFNQFQKDFIALYRRYVNDPKRTTGEIHEYLRKRTGEELQQAVDAYLRDSVHFQQGTHPRALTIFFAALSTAIEKSDAYYAMKVDAEIGTAGTVWAQRFQSLKDHESARLREWLNLRKKLPRVIDQVKFAYYTKHRKDPDLKDLRAFEPTSNKEQEDLVSSALSSCDVAVGARNPDSFTKGFTQLSNVLLAQKDTLTLVLLLKRCREYTRLPRHFRQFVDLYGVAVLFGQGIRRVNPGTYYARGFTAEEWKWLLDDTATGYYYQDFVLQLEYAVSGRNAYDLFDIFKAYGALLIFAERFRLNLMPLAAAATLRGAVEELWRKKPDEVCAIPIKIGARELKVGDTFGNFYLLWWDRNRSTAYVLVNGFENVVFEMGEARLSNALYEADTYGAIYEATKHLLVLIPLLFEILGYIPDLVSGGATGLVKSVIADQLFDKSIEALGIEPTALPVAQIGLALLQHGTRPKHTASTTHRQSDFSDVQQKSIQQQGAHMDAATYKKALQDQGIIDLADVRATKQAAKTPEIIEVRKEQRVAMAASGGGGGDYRTGHVDTSTSAGGDVAGRTSQGRGLSGNGADSPPIARGTAGGVPDVFGRFTNAKAANANVAVGSPGQPPTLRQTSGQDVGTWRDAGGVWTNEGAVDFHVPRRQNQAESDRLTRKMRDEARDEFRTFEHGFNQQLAPRLAAMLSDRPVVRMGKGAPKRRKPHSREERAELEFQGRLRGDPIDRIPDAKLSIYEKAPNGGEVLKEVHFMEATLQTDFVAAVSSAGHKQRQIWGTVRIMQAGSIKGFTPNTKIYYHIMTPGPPTEASTKFLSNLMKSNPGLEIRWYVVGAR